MSTIDSIDLHVRTYRSALKSNLEITVNSLTNYHLKTEPNLHSQGSNPTVVDFPALTYSLQRLPAEIDRSERILIGQTPEIFATAGFSEVTRWPRVTALARRRTCHFHADKKILAVFAASISDIDDLINLIIAYQIEWNKFHTLLTVQYPDSAHFLKALKSDQIVTDLKLNPDEYSFFIKSLTPADRLHRIYHQPLDLRLRLLAGSYLDYTKTTNLWYRHLSASTRRHFGDLYRRSIYFVSSNTYSLAHIGTGFALQHRSAILSYLRLHQPEIYQNYQKIKDKELHLSLEDFFYFASKYLINQPSFRRQFQQETKKLGCISIPSAHYLDINTQICPVKALAHARHLDPRLKISRPQKLAKSEALIFNIDYPLGAAAYHILNELLENVGKVKGIYVLGKAAVLNGEMGDIQIPRLVFDEHSQNTFIFKNCFNSFFPFTNQSGSILTNQKAVTVLGTFLQNQALIDKYSENNLTIVEMESGPYLSAITEATYDVRNPSGTIVDLNSAPFDIGIINYTSDTPYSRYRSLGVSHPTLSSIEPVFLGSLAILQRIINLEEAL